MKKTRYVFASLAALALVATACGSDKEQQPVQPHLAARPAADETTAPADTASATTAAPADTASADTVDVTAGQDITIAVITHGDGGVFWSVFQKGAEDAGKDGHHGQVPGSRTTPVPTRPR